MSCYPIKTYLTWKGQLDGYYTKTIIFPDIQTRCSRHETRINGTAKTTPALNNFTTPCTQNIYISSSEWFYQTVQEVSDAIPGPDITLQTAEGSILINKKEA